LAVFHFRAALVTADTAEGHYNLATALLKQANFDDAFDQFKTALRLNPKSTAVYKAWGQALVIQGKPDEAARLYQEGLQHSPADPLIHYNLAAAWDAQNRNAEAVAEYTQAARLGLATADLWLRLGRLLIEQGKLADAESSLAKAVAIQPDLADAQFKLALAQQQQGKYADAIKHYEAMLTLTPDHPETLNNMALIYAAAADAQVRNPKMAVMLATRASTATSDQNSRYMDTLARSYAADGDFSQAIVWENKAIHRARQLNQQDLLKELDSRYARFQQQKTE
jgi:tetratricopeptide (TPR) repeat protein